MKTQRRVVVADDEPLLVRELVAYLEDMGHLVVGTAANGCELVECVRETLPDVVITDIKMPMKDGLEAAREIWSSSPMPVILVSAFHDEDFIAQTKSEQILSYIVKPVDENQLATAVGKLDGTS